MILVVRYAAISGAAVRRRAIKPPEPSLALMLLSDTWCDQTNMINKIMMVRPALPSQTPKMAIPAPTDTSLLVSVFDDM
jgi:hypothetical protein